MLISLAKLCTAFNLTPDELAELRQVLPTKPVIEPYRLLIDPKDRFGQENDAPQEFTEELASVHATKYVSKVLWTPQIREKTVNLVLGQLLEMYREMESDYGVRQEWPSLAAEWGKPIYYGILTSYIDGSVFSLREQLLNNLKGSYLLFSLVPLEEAALLLYMAKFPLRQEVKGLTREQYQEIIARLNPPAEPTDDAPVPLVSAGAEPVEDVLTPAAQAEPEPAPVTEKETRRLPVAALLNAIRAEAEICGLDQKYYVKTDRSIRYWLRGIHTPAGFSESVLSDLASITDFAKKYIAAAVAGGSSELAANAKKEVAFNEQLHGVQLETVEDAELMMDALKEAAERLPSESGVTTKRRPKR